MQCANAEKVEYMLRMYVVLSRRKLLWFGTHTVFGCTYANDVVRAYLKKPEGPAVPLRRAVVARTVLELFSSREKRPGPNKLVEAPRSALHSERYPPTERPPHDGSDHKVQ